jgi:tRNA pseudouridine55 synthase
MTYGIINIYKEKGYTSHDVVAILRKKLRMKKIGHTGTLDPEAEGVLPICLGKATKAVDFLTNKDKVYLATMVLGTETDTQDHTGNVIATREVTCTEEAIIRVIEDYVGEYEQTPPMYSAIKQNGKRLYELARAGKVVEREKRKVNIHHINHIKVDGIHASFEVSCSKGTYIRTLCHDIGETLHCGGHMTSLIRTKVGNFNLENSIKINEIDDYVLNESIHEIITPVEDLFDQYDKVIIDEKYNKYLYNGNKLPLHYTRDNYEGPINHVYRLYDEQRMFIGLYKLIDEESLAVFKPMKIFI